MATADLLWIFFGSFLFFAFIGLMVVLASLIDPNGDD